MQRPILFAALALTWTLTSCGGGSSDPRELLSSGSRALGSHDYAAALADFQKASDALAGDKSDALYVEIQKGLLCAKAGSTPADAISSLSALGSDLGDAIDVELYSSVAGHMSEAGHFDQAVEVVGLADTRFGKTELMTQQVDNIKEQMESAGATGALDALAGLGYVGD